MICYLHRDFVLSDRAFFPSIIGMVVFASISYGDYLFPNSFQGQYQAVQISSARSFALVYIHYLNKS